MAFFPNFTALFNDSLDDYFLSVPSKVFTCFFWSQEFWEEAEDVLTCGSMNRFEAFCCLTVHDLMLDLELHWHQSFLNFPPFLPARREDCLLENRFQLRSGILRSNFKRVGYSFIFEESPQILSKHYFLRQLVGLLPADVGYVGIFVSRVHDL